MKTVKIMDKRKTVVYKTAWVVFILYACLMLWEVFIGPYRVHGRARIYNLYPFKTIAYYFVNSAHNSSGVVFINLAANIITFIPFGFLIPVLFKKFGKLKELFILSLITVTFIEVMQFVLNVGVFDVDDIILNCTGCIIGFLLYRAAARLVMKNLHN